MKVSCYYQLHPVSKLHMTTFAGPSFTSCMGHHLISIIYGKEYFEYLTKIFAAYVRETIYPSQVLFILS